VSTAQQIAQVYASEIRYPTDLCHNGHQYKRAYMIRSETVRKLRAIRRTLRVHRVYAIST
jgi:hypothetical protein